MKKIIPLSMMCLLLLGIGQAQAQTAEQPLGFKLGFGLNGYRGDLGNTMLQFPQNNFMWTMGLSYYLSQHFGLALEANFFTMRKENGPNDSVVKKQNTSFSTSDINLDLLLRIKPFTTRLNPYIAIGLGANWLKNIDDMRKEDNNFIFSLPVGVGVNYKISDQFSFNAQMLYNWTFTDDIIDSYPSSAGKLVSGTAHKDIDGKSSDKYLLTTVGIVFNFGGGDIEKDHPILAQSMKNLKAAQNASELAADNLRQAQQLNDKTLQAIDDLKVPQTQKNQLKEEFVHIVNNIQFAFDKSDILATAQEELNSLADIINHYPGLQVDIAGHADKRGSESYNESLSQRRVQSVKEYLMSHGVDSAQITTNAYGESQPLLNKSADVQTTYAQNRAVQLTLSYHNPQSK